MSQTQKMHCMEHLVSHFPFNLQIDGGRGRGGLGGGGGGGGARLCTYS